MKKLVYLIIMSLLLTLVPVDSAEAATKVSGPTVTPVYDKKRDDFAYKLAHPNKNAIIYYRDAFDGKWKKAKNGQTIRMDYDFYVYAKVGKTKSKARLIDEDKSKEKRVDYLIKQEMNKLIDKDDTKDMKFIKLLGYFKNNYDYIWLEGCAKRDWDGNLTYYRKGGMCAELAVIFVRYCEAIGIKAEYIDSLYSDIDYTYTNNHAWTHVYIDEYPILVDPTSIVCCGNLHGDSLWDNDSYKNSKYKFTRASKCGHGTEYVKNNKICYLKPPFEDSIPWRDRIVKLEKNKVIVRYNDEGTNYEETYEYYPNTGYWYLRCVNIDTGEVLEDDKAEVDAWYAAHPEVERKYGKYAVRE